MNVKQLKEAIKYLGDDFIVLSYRSGKDSFDDHYVEASVCLDRVVYENYEYYMYDDEYKEEFYDKIIDAIIIG